MITARRFQTGPVRFLTILMFGAMAQIGFFVAVVAAFGTRHIAGETIGRVIPAIVFGVAMFAVGIFGAVRSYKMCLIIEPAVAVVPGIWATHRVSLTNVIQLGTAPIGIGRALYLVTNDGTVIAIRGVSSPVRGDPTDVAVAALQCLEQEYEAASGRVMPDRSWTQSESRRNSPALHQSTLPPGVQVESWGGRGFLRVFLPALRDPAIIGFLILGCQVVLCVALSLSTQFVTMAAAVLILIMLLLGFVLPWVLFERFGKIGVSEHLLAIRVPRGWTVFDLSRLHEVQLQRRVAAAGLWARPKINDSIVLIDDQTNEATVVKQALTAPVRAAVLRHITPSVMVGEGASSLLHISDVW